MQRIDWNIFLLSAIPEDAINEESDDEDRENPDSRISSKLHLNVYCVI